MPEPITIPFHFDPREYQLPFFKAMDAGMQKRGMRAVIVWHRRSGKDKAVLNYIIKRAFEKKGTYFYFFPTYSQGNKVLWQGMDKDGFRFLDHFPAQGIRKKNETEMRIELVNGSIFQIIGSDNIDSIVGTNPAGVAFSEYALSNPAAWDYIRPILAENGGFAIFNFTPRGMNHGFRILQQLKNAIEEGDNNTAKPFVQVLTVSDTNAIPEDVLEQEKREMPADLFEQEYYCKFIDGAGQYFKRIEDNVWNGDMVPIGGRHYQIGVDLAKYQDFTVFTVIDRHTFKIGIQERFNNVDYSFQKSRLEALSRRYNNAKIVMDSTGLGEPIHDDLVRSGMNVEPFHFTENSRKELLENLRLLLSEGKIILPSDEELFQELKSMSYRLSQSGKLKIEVPSGLHDDRIMSLALAVWKIGQRIGTETNRELARSPEFSKERGNVSRFHY